MPRYTNGQMVEYKPVGGPNSNTSNSTGTIKGVLTKPGVQLDRRVDASVDRPRYEIENSRTHRHTSVSEGNILGEFNENE